MSNFDNQILLLALIDANHQEAIDFAMTIVKGAPVNNNGTNGNLSPVNEKPLDIGQETDASTLDKAGLPWDSRIHAKTKTTNKDGTWKYAVGVDREVLVPQVEAELRQQYPAPEANDQPVSEPVTPAAATPPGAPVNVASSAQSSANAASAPGLPPVGAPAAPGLPPVAATPPVAPKVEFPQDLAGEEDMTDENMEQTAAALYAKHGAEAVTKLLALFQVPEGGTAKDIQAGYKHHFWAYATNDENLRAQMIIS